MYGFDAIATHNGWAMAAVGASIVFAGLMITTHWVYRSRYEGNILATPCKAIGAFTRKFKLIAIVPCFGRMISCLACGRAGVRLR